MDTFFAFMYGFYLGNSIRIYTRVRLMTRKERKKRPSKKQNQNFHAKQRFKERFDLDFTRKVRFEFLNIIKRDYATLVRKSSNRAWVYRVMYLGNFYNVVYDKRTDTIVTVFPKEDS